MSQSMKKKQGSVSLVVFLWLLSAWLMPLQAQPIRALQQGNDSTSRQSAPGLAAGQTVDEVDLAGEFAFVRVQYDSYFRGGFGYGPWSVDFPDADRNFLRGVARLSHVRVMPEPIVLRLDDDQIFELSLIHI